MPATQNVDMAKGRHADSAITKKRFVKLVAGTAETVEMCDTAGEMAYGVAIYSVSDAEILKGKDASVLVDGRAIVESSAAIAEGAAVATGNDGRAHTATSGQFILGFCDEASAGTGDECSVVLSFSGAKAA